MAGWHDQAGGEAWPAAIAGAGLLTQVGSIEEGDDVDIDDDGDVEDEGGGRVGC